jgi:hypothetical protein
MKDKDENFNTIIIEKMILSEHKFTSGIFHLMTAGLYIEKNIYEKNIAFKFYGFVAF